MESLSGSEIVMMVIVAIGSAAIGSYVYTMIPSLATNYSWAVWAFPAVGFLVGAGIDFYFYYSKPETEMM